MRERTIVINTLLLPVFLYPVILWVMFTAITFVQGLNEGFTSRVALISPAPTGHEALRDSLLGDTELSFWGGEQTASGQPIGISPERTALPVVDSAAAMAMLSAREIDAVISFGPPVAQGAPLGDNFRAIVRYDRSINRSRSARDRVDSHVADYRAAWIEDASVSLGMSDQDRTPFTVEREDVSTSEDIGALVLGQMISLFLVIMVALGCFIPAVDTTAGERERSTWETLMTVSASRGSVVFAKYLHVATLGVLAGTLNVIALFVSIGAVIKPLLAGVGGAGDEITFAIPLGAWPGMLVGAIALALFFASAMMILASFARSFKDGQAMIQPVYWLVFLPMLLGQRTDLTLTPMIAAIPVANVSIMIRDAVNGVFIWPLMGMTLAVTAIFVAAFLWIARRILGFEDFLLGSFDGSFWRFLKRRLLGRGPAYPDPFSK